ncbi:MAG: siderophore-interacting protein [Rhizomicrobium sp.]
MSIAEPQSPGALAQIGLFLQRKGRRVWPLTVQAKRLVTPRMMRVIFTVPKLDELVWKRGQDLVLELPQADGTIARRHYTIRTLDAEAGTLAIDFVLHGDSPAGSWVRAAEPGAQIHAAGPRGHTYLHEADWHLFAGDETCIPGIFAMLEGQPPGATAFLEIADDAERQPAPDGARVVWLPRGGAAPGPSRILYDAVEAFAFPPGRGHAYVIGETSNVRAIRQRLIARGLGKEQTCAEGYWRPGRVGGHDHA